MTSSSNYRGDINMTPGNSTHNDRLIMALYYAHGRNDAPDGATVVGALPFAEWYAAQWDEFQRGECSFMPSVQDAWDTYRRSVK
jgi:hypothetical protein